MRNISILPADTYVVVNKTVIREDDRRLLTMLYQPIIGYTAVSLYFTLIDDLDELKRISNDLNHHHLMSIMQFRMVMRLRLTESGCRDRGWICSGQSRKNSAGRRL